MDDKALIKAAIEARQNSYSPYSKFMVGAALLTESGKVYTGCNVENAGYSPTNCAERTAFFKAVSEGEQRFQKIAVAGWSRDAAGGFAYPCGVCRQVMIEFCDPDTFTILIASGEETYEKRTLSQLLPDGFGPKTLKVKTISG